MVGQYVFRSTRCRRATIVLCLKSALLGSVNIQASVSRVLD
jgi:hypothetical protein